MPNVEIHGLKDYEGLQTSTRKKIFEVTQRLPFANEIVVTIVSDECRNRRLAAQPFLRVICDESEMQELIEHLKILNMDTEILLVKDFIPGKSLVP